MGMMSGRERIEAVLSGGVPDRLPTLEWIINPNVMEKMAGTRSDLEFVDIMDIEGVSIGLNGKNEYIDSRHIKDEWGITRVTYDEYPNPVGFPIATMEDMDGFAVPDPNAPWRLDSIKAAMERFGNEKCICARVRDVFSQPRDLMGFENFLMSFYEEPELAQLLMKISCEFSMRICERVAESGVKVIVVGDDYANNNALLISPPMFREFVLPHFARLVRHAKACGLYVIKHSDGDLRAIADDLIASGIDCLDPIDERGNMLMGEMKQKYGGKIALKGNIDCVSTLVDKDVSQVRRETARCILNGAQGGGLIISSSNSIHSGINPENYKAFLDARAQLGQYPLDIEKLSEEAK